MTDIREIPIHQKAEDAYLQYSIATVTDRSLLNLKDGNKPVHRRILYAMKLLGLLGNVKHIKSARVVGDVIGKYHPHGDAAVYDTMVRMAQPFSMRYPLIDGQGNFGTRNGDPAAAQRYTEAKLCPISDLLLSEIDKGTVDFEDNYDGSFKEPSILPARLPFGLLNGTIGIAVGLASTIPSHNIREIAAACIQIIENKDTKEDDIFDHILGPDYPGGGQIITSKENMIAAYKAGRGPIVCRGIWHKEDMARGQWQIIITQLPYLVSPSTIANELDLIVNPKNKDGKALTPKQIQLRQTALDLMDSAVDMSDKNNEVRLIIQPRTSKVDPDVLMAFLCANTSIEDTVNLNLTVLDNEGVPGVLSLFDHLKGWCRFRIETVIRRTNWSLNKCQARIHILEGRILAFNHLNDVIRIIRESENPLNELMTEIGFTEPQAYDILEMKLRQINRLEDTKLYNELTSMKKEEAALLKLLASDKLMRNLVVKEIKEDIEKYGDDRRSIVKEESSAKAVAATLFSTSVKEEDISVTVSNHLWIKAYKGHEITADQISLNPGDSLNALFKISNSSPISFLDSSGRIYSISAAQVSFKGDGSPLTTFINLQDNAKVVASLNSSSDNSRYLFSSSKGLGFVTKGSSLVTRQKAGKAFLSVPAGFEVMTPVLIENDSDYIACLTSMGFLSIFPVSEVKELANGGQGVQLMDLSESDYVSKIAIISVESLNAALDIFDLKIKQKEVSKYVTKRARRGKKVA